MQENYKNLIPEEIEVYNFIPQELNELKVRANYMTNKGDQDKATEEGLLYNMAFMLDTLLNQVKVLDSYI